MLIPGSAGLLLINIIDMHPLVPSIGSGDPTPKYLNQLKLLSTLSETSDLKDKCERYFSLAKAPFLGSTIFACVTLIALNILLVGTVTGIAASAAPLCTGAVITIIGIVAGFAANYFSSKRIKNAKLELENYLNTNKLELRLSLERTINDEKFEIAKIIDSQSDIKKAPVVALEKLLSARKNINLAEKTLEDFFSNEDTAVREEVV